MWTGSRDAMREHYQACREHGVSVGNLKYRKRRRHGAKVKKSRWRECEQKPLLMKQPCLDVLRDLAGLQVTAMDLGMELVAKRFHGPHRRPSLHVMLNHKRSGRLLVDWWPATGTWRACDDRQGKSFVSLDVIDLAYSLIRG